ncbi:MAG TPA: SAM-dependent chlorinase/fluorinase [Thermoleophilaceae bacterium]|nr:SAM-dependent chlorinase/fluorinase [Thermoleophilaceae bacterium]
MIVSLLTDYGHEDEFVGVCHAVIRGIAPDVAIVDLTHGIPRYGVRQGAVVLRNSLPYVPVGVHVAIVDPQVGTERRGLAVRTGDGRALVGPDNGLLSLAWEACGGVVEAVDISRSHHRLEPVSATFHGRDIFAPVAAHLAAGAPLADAGEHVEPDELQLLDLPKPEVREREVLAHVVLVDRFGNASLNVGHDELAGTGISLGRTVEIEARGERFIGTFTQTFADVRRGELILYEDAQRMLAVAINRGDAAAALRLAPDAPIVLRPR